MARTGRAGRDTARPRRDDEFVRRQGFGRLLHVDARDVRTDTCAVYVAASAAGLCQIRVAPRGHHADGQHRHGDRKPGCWYQDEEHLSRFPQIGRVTLSFDIRLPSLEPCLTGLNQTSTQAVRPVRRAHEAPA